MLKKDVTRADVDNAIAGKGEYIQIDTLNRIISNMPHILVKLYAYSKLIEIYSSKKMFNDLGKTYDNMAINSINAPDRVSNFIKATQAYIQDMAFEKADISLRKAMNEAPEPQRVGLYVSIKEYYKRCAEQFEKDTKRAQAAKIYEKLMLMRLADSEKEDVKKKLVDLYQKLGKFKEQSNLEKRKY